MLACPMMCLGAGLLGDISETRGVPRDSLKEGHGTGLNTSALVTVLEATRVDVPDLMRYPEYFQASLAPQHSVVRL